MRILQLTSLCLSIIAFACSAAREPAPSDSAASEPAASEPPAAARIDSLASPLENKQYVDARYYFTEPADIDGWYALTSTLRANFDAICGDTFCEGDYSNYESLGFRCSVEQQSGVIGRCVWIFAASNDEINATTGNVKVDGKLWRCRMPIAPSTSAGDFLRALSAPGEQPLHAQLPGREVSLYDGLVDCL